MTRWTRSTLLLMLLSFWLIQCGSDQGDGEGVGEVAQPLPAYSYTSWNTTANGISANSFGHFSFVNEAGPYLHMFEVTSNGVLRHEVLTASGSQYSGYSWADVPGQSGGTEILSGTTPSAIHMPSGSWIIYSVNVDYDVQYVLYYGGTSWSDWYDVDFDDSIEDIRHVAVSRNPETTDSAGRDAYYMFMISDDDGEGLYSFDYDHDAADVYAGDWPGPFEMDDLPPNCTGEPISATATFSAYGATVFMADTTNKRVLYNSLRDVNYADWDEEERPDPGPQWFRSFSDTQYPYNGWRTWGNGTPTASGLFTADRVQVQPYWNSSQDWDTRTCAYITWRPWSYILQSYGSEQVYELCHTPTWNEYAWHSLSTYSGAEDILGLTSGYGWQSTYGTQYIFEVTSNGFREKRGTVSDWTGTP